MNWLQKIAQEVPQVFRVSIRMDDDAAAQLANRQLIGVTGISAANTAAFQFFTVARNEMLMMPGYDTTSINNLQNIKYGDPEQMMQDNMKILVRIFDQRDTENVISRLLAYTIPLASQYATYGNFLYFMERSSFWSKLALEFKEQGLPEINSVEELAQWLMRVAPVLAKHWEGEWGEKMMTLSYNNWIYLINGALKKVAEIFGDEEEWIVTDGVLNIPSGSTLYLSVDKLPEDPQILEDWNSGDEDVRSSIRSWGAGQAFDRMEKVNEWVSKFGLNRLYKIRYVEKQEFENKRNDYNQSKRDNT